MTTCCSVLGLIFLVITNLTIIIAFATPYWVEFDVGMSNQGLWAFCVKDQCTWVFEDNYKLLTSTMEVDSAWWIATLGLTSGGLAMSLFALLLATIALCCDCRGCNASHAIAGLLLFAFLALGVAAAVFGVCANKYNDVALKHDTPMQQFTGKKFGWSFWLDCGAAGMAMLTALIYIIEGRSKSA